MSQLNGKEPYWEVAPHNRHHKCLVIAAKERHARYANEHGVLVPEFVLEDGDVLVVREIARGLKVQVMKNDTGSVTVRVVGTGGGTLYLPRHNWHPRLWKDVYDPAPDEIRIVFGSAPGMSERRPENAHLREAIGVVPRRF